MRARPKYSAAIDPSCWMAELKENVEGRDPHHKRETGGILIIVESTLRIAIFTPPITANPEIICNLGVDLDCCGDVQVGLLLVSQEPMKGRTTSIEETLIYVVIHSRVLLADLNGHV